MPGGVRPSAGPAVAAAGTMPPPWLGPCRRRGPCRRLGPKCRRLAPRCRRPDPCRRCLRPGPACRRRDPRCRRPDPKCPACSGRTCKLRIFSGRTWAPCNGPTRRGLRCRTPAWGPLGQPCPRDRLGRHRSRGPGSARCGLPLACLAARSVAGPAATAPGVWRRCREAVLRRGLRRRSVRVRSVVVAASVVARSVADPAATAPVEPPLCPAVSRA